VNHFFTFGFQFCTPNVEGWEHNFLKKTFQIQIKESHALLNKKKLMLHLKFDTESGWKRK
jgi:hypothetical protein